MGSIEIIWPGALKQAIAKNPVFEYGTLAVILLNAIWIAIDTDHNREQDKTTFMYVENGFCAFFTLELLIRFCAFQRKRSAIRDSWFIFDAVLVVIMIVETWIMGSIEIVWPGALKQDEGDVNTQNSSILKLLKLLRLTRMARMVRLLRVVPELMILIKGMAVATRSVFFTLCLLVVIIYVYSIAFVQITEGSEV